VNQLTNWPKHIVTWWDNEVLNISVVFSWQLSYAVKYRDAMLSRGCKIKIGGPAAKLVGIQDGDVPALIHHNPYATFTSRGCPNRCQFCAVPKIEGDLVELDDWEPKPVVCDNNLLGCSVKHFDSVIDRLKPIKYVDFNQGLDARLLTDHHIERLRELSTPQLRFAWDNVATESYVMSAIERVKKAGFPSGRIHAYVLFGFKDTPEDALYRFEKLRDLGIKPNPMRYQPLDALKRNCYVGEHWTKEELKRMMRYWARQNWFSKIPYSEYVH